MGNKKTTTTMVRATKEDHVPDPTREEQQKPGSARENLQRLVTVIKALGKEQGLPVTEQEMALKTGVSADTFNAYLAGEAPAPKQLFSTLLAAYNHLFEANRRENNLRIIQHSVLWIRNQGLATGVSITLEEMAGKAGISGKQLQAYLRGEEAVPDDVSSRLELAYKKLLKNVTSVELTEDLDTILGAG